MRGLFDVVVVDVIVVVGLIEFGMTGIENSGIIYPFEIKVKVKERNTRLNI